jgi:hypothetical protein
MLKTVSSITNAIGALNFKGTWDANANSPALASSVGTKGDYYVVGTAGSTNLNGISNWGVGDLATFTWHRIVKLHLPHLAIPLSSLLLLLLLQAFRRSLTHVLMPRHRPVPHHQFKRQHSFLGRWPNCCDCYGQRSGSGRWHAIRSHCAGAWCR